MSERSVDNQMMGESEHLLGGTCYARENPDCAYCQQCGAGRTVNRLGGVIGRLGNRNAFWWAAATAALSASVASAIAGWPL